MSRSAEKAVPQGQMDHLRAEAAEWKDKYMRLYAEQENTRKRMERNYAHQAKQEKERILRDILPLVDNLERALAHAPAEQASLQEGVQLTLKALNNMLAKHDVARIDAAGRPFDPNLHEAVGVIPHPTLPPGTVASVEEAGYTYQGKLLRPARVLVTAD